MVLDIEKKAEKLKIGQIVNDLNIPVILIADLHARIEAVKSRFRADIHKQKEIINGIKQKRFDLGVEVNDGIIE